jgi:nucleoside-diphosphate-sugar epimerase
VVKRVLLTGASGFIGRNCLEPLLARDFEVHAVYTRAPLQGPSGIIWHRANLLDPGEAAALVERVEPGFLLHLAWYVEHGHFWTAPENLDWVQASLGLLRAFARVGGERVLMSGSCAEYDWSYGLCSEAETPLKPATLYGICKHALQTILASFGRESGLSTAWGRIFFAHGPFEPRTRLVPSVVRSLLAGQPALCTHGDQKRDFLHVTDVGDAFAALLASRVEGPVNIGSGEAVALKEVVGGLARQVNGEHLVQLGAIPAPSSDPPLLVADTRRLRDEVGWTPAMDFAAGLEATFRWWRDEYSEATYAKAR